MHGCINEEDYRTFPGLKQDWDFGDFFFLVNYARLTGD